jgi:hypothetical protein
MKQILMLFRMISISGLLVCAHAIAQASFMFGVVDNATPQPEHESLLIQSLVEIDAQTFPFVVIHGIKSMHESCSDNFLLQRYDLFNLAQTPVILTINADDWVSCSNKKGSSIATNRLSRMREIFYADATSLGTSSLPLLTQSVLPQFRNYPENLRWEYQHIQFASLNLPSPNNHWLENAGPNTEFEDRLIANKAWLHHIFSQANVKKSLGIVLSVDANFLHSASSSLSILHQQRDGFKEIRQQFLALARHFKGRILIIYRSAQEATEPSIQWHSNIGSIAVQGAWMSIAIDPTSPMLFSVHHRQSVLHKDIDSSPYNPLYGSSP